ncbi:hypothetical protein A5724_06570 [Mycobacterium sp. ACS1612]|uniref:DUF1942 domain-containing protein n=1 Tax=Mycobacterium sp. ACS1612 TaxID=1834117 RepID=UPI00080057AF|nr:DUF1942 domain-containing protein [Mycobacterium sp. ACS1612]OBF40729.1 hypothetical protein A5724_06570 [Mycobacterium sp. ACS1612]
MKIKKAAGAVAATAAMLGLGAVPLAGATSNIQVMGVQETLKDMNGPLIGYTVTGLMPSSDPVPYPVAGRLYEATVKADALVGTVIPVVPFFNARAESGANYRVLANVSSLSGAPIGQGGSTTGKVYFDVVGDPPNSVVFNNGFEDILGWIQTANPATPGGSPTGGGSSTGTNGGAPGGGGNAQLGPFNPGGNAGGNSGNNITGNDPGAGGGATGGGGSGAAGGTGSGAAGGGAG